MKQKTFFQIGEIAKKSETPIDTIRYYEKLSLIKKPTRSEGGFRMYSSETIEKLLFIKKAKSFGLTLDEIRQIMKCGERGLEPCCDLVAKVFANKINEFESKIKELQKMKKRLNIVLSGWTKSQSIQNRARCRGV